MENPQAMDEPNRTRGTGGGNAGGRIQLEGVLSKYTNLIQGWQNRYFVLDEDLNQLQYFVSENGRSHKPRGILPLTGASVTASNEAPHMFIITTANGELFKLRAMNAKEQQLWIERIHACTVQKCGRPVTDTNEDKKVLNSDTQASSRRSFSLLASSSSSSSSSPKLQRLHPHLPNIHHPHKPAAASNDAKHTHADADTLLEVKEVICQVECEQKSLVHSIDSLPRRGCVSCLDPDLLLIKATSAATLRCLTQCLSMLQLQNHACNGPEIIPSQASHTSEPNMNSVKTASSQVPLTNDL